MENVAEPEVRELRVVEYLYSSASGTLALRVEKPLSELMPSMIALLF
jgi:hypothetical protein